MNHHIICLDEKIDKRRINAKACEVALTRIRDIIMTEEGVKRAGSTEPIVNFPKITCTGITEYYGRTRAKRNTRYHDTYAFFRQ